MPKIGRIGIRKRQKLIPTAYHVPQIENRPVYVIKYAQFKKLNGSPDLNSASVRSKREYYQNCYLAIVLCLCSILYFTIIRAAHRFSVPDFSACHFTSLCLNSFLFVCYLDLMLLFVFVLTGGQFVATCALFVCLVIIVHGEVRWA